MENKPLINRVANSGLITINLEDFYPTKELIEFDLKPYLFKELILKEKDFRAALKEIDWASYSDKVLLIYCSTDAIIPVWAYMLVSSNAAPFVFESYQGTSEEYLKKHYDAALNIMEFEQFTQKKVVVKGCSNKAVPASAYAKLSARLQPYAQSIMYGEPCSTVPIFKRPRVL